MVVLSAVGSGCVITQNVEVTCMRQHKRTNLLETYLPVGTFQNEIFYVTGRWTIQTTLDSMHCDETTPLEVAVANSLAA